jgi:hypothetical protein
MKVLFVTIVLLLTLSAHSQKGNAKKDKLDAAIDSLGWHSFGIATTYFMNFYLKKDAKKLLEWKDDRKLQKLFNRLEDSSKTVVIHALLTMLLEPKKAQLGGSYIYKDSSIVSIAFTFNNLRWEAFFEENPSIKREVILNAKKYWLHRLTNKKKKRNVKI